MGFVCARAAPNCTAGSTEHVARSRPSARLTPGPLGPVGLNSLVTTMIAGAWPPFPRQSGVQER
jgi:hypothetical protein